MVLVGKSDLDVFPVQLGGNVFGWTADEAASFAILDAFVEGGGNFVDTADSYSAWIPGNKGGESETIIGNWMQARGNREKVIIATKVGNHPQNPGASRVQVLQTVNESLSRLQTDYIDLYYIHKDDPNTPLEETLGALAEIVQAGKVRWVAASNYSPQRLSEALTIASETNAPEFVALQPPYSLVNRSVFEGELESVVTANGLGTLTYSSLGGGFLSGKYRPDQALPETPRAGGASKNLDGNGPSILRALDAIAASHGVAVASVALAWIRQRASVTAPIASASSVDQVATLLTGGTLELSAEEIDSLNAASA